MFAAAKAVKRLSPSLAFATRCVSQHVSIQDNIERKRAKAMLGGGQDRIDAQHQKVLVLCTLFRLLHL